jgi:hypothetical protein
MPNSNTPEVTPILAEMEILSTLFKSLLQFRQWRAVFKGDRDRRREVFLFV